MKLSVKGVAIFYIQQADMEPAAKSPPTYLYQIGRALSSTGNKIKNSKTILTVPYEKVHYALSNV